MQGDVVQAMELANDLDPTMLDRDRCVCVVVVFVTAPPKKPLSTVSAELRNVDFRASRQLRGFFAWRVFSCESPWLFIGGSFFCNCQAHKRRFREVLRRPARCLSTCRQSPQPKSLLSAFHLAHSGASPLARQLRVAGVLTEATGLARLARRVNQDTVDACTCLL